MRPLFDRGRFCRSAMLWTGVFALVTTRPSEIAFEGRQDKRPTVGAIMGRVVEDLTVVGVPEAAVALVDSTGKKVAKLTDSNGYFAFTDLVPGAYSLTAQKSGYWQGVYGQRRPNGSGRRFILSPGIGQVGPVVLSVWRLGGISGRLMTESGQPLSGQRVEALSETERAGRLAFDVAGGTVSDDRGAYSIKNLFPGEYIVRIAATQSDDRVTDTTYYPAGRRPSDAVLVAAPAGEDRQNVDIQRRQLELRIVRGRLRDSAGGSVAGVDVQVLSQDQGLVFDQVLGSVKTSADGAFQFRVEPGNYLLRALDRGGVPSRPGGSQNTAGRGSTLLQGPAKVVSVSRWAAGSVSVSMQGEDPDATLLLYPSNSIQGHVAFDNPPPSNSGDLIRRVGLFLEVADGRQVSDVSIRAGADGVFYADGVPGGEYFMRAVSPRGWSIERVTVGGRDGSAEPMTLVAADTANAVVRLTADNATITGSVRSAKGERDDSAIVLIFPADENKWRDTGIDSQWFREVRVNEAGDFLVSDVPPGGYMVVAVADTTSSWRASSHLAALVRLATHVTARPRETSTLHLVTQPGR